MKILMVTKSDHKGGASIASLRLFRALVDHSDIEVSCLVQRKKTAYKNIIEIWGGVFKELFFLFIERFLFSFFEKSKKTRFKFSPAWVGDDITKYEDFQRADLIHLHWFNNGFLSLSNIERILESGKPVVWTLHDMWAFTGGCHYTGGCVFFRDGCGYCPLLRKPSKNDLSFRLFKKKQQIYKKNEQLVYVTCSNWLKRESLKSPLISGSQVNVIPNTLDTNTFRPLDKDVICEKHHLNPNKRFILFGAANIQDDRKGFSFLFDALHYISVNYQNVDQIELLIFGRSQKEVFKELPFKVHFLSYLNSVEEIVESYNIADCFILPSLEDNLPNTVLESFSCGTPVVAFKTGGIPDMIDHKMNGYLAEYKSVQDLSYGLLWVLFHADYEQLSRAARAKVLYEFNEEIIAHQYLKLYRQLCSEDK